MTPHPFTATRGKPQRCALCQSNAGAAWHSLELFTDAHREREAARQVAEAEELTARMRTVKADISRAAGEMEREAPLFYGTGENPSLF